MTYIGTRESARSDTAAPVSAPTAFGCHATALVRLLVSDTSAALPPTPVAGPVANAGCPSLLHAPQPAGSAGGTTVSKVSVKRTAGVSRASRCSSTRRVRACDMCRLLLNGAPRASAVRVIVTVRSSAQLERTGDE
ncbi:MAG: hypothetical protein FJ304_20330 [Planctomycetes bacterium]|nr:hypothetical protein [Planctomycetota bacterium]